MNTRIITTALAASILAIPAVADAPGYFKVPGTETTLKIYGKAETWGFYNINQSQGSSKATYKLNDLGATVLDKAAKPLGDQSWNRKGTVDSFTAGRIGITSTTPSAYGDVNVKVEFEMKTTGGKESWDTAFRLRHAYGEFGGLLIGQTTSLFMAWQYCPAYNDTWHADFNEGQARTRQIRYTFAPTKEIQVALSAEQDLSGGDSTKLGSAFVGAFQYAADWGSVQAAVGYQKKSDWAKAAGGAVTSASGSGVSFNVGGSWNITPNDTIGARIIKGGSQNGNDAYDIGDGFVADPDDYSFYKSTSMDLGYSHTWNDSFNTNLGVAQIIFPKDTDLGHGSKVTVTEFFVNTNWNVTKNAEFGVEYFNSAVKYNDGNPVAKVDGTATNKFKNDGFNVKFIYNFF